MIALGFSRHAIGRMITKGQLHVVHRSTYAAGPARLTREGRWMAAVLAAGAGAVLSHRSAAALWQLLPERAGDIEVTTARRAHPRRGVQDHFAQLAGDEITTFQLIPVTTVARTLLDIAAQLAPDRLERAMHEAEVRRLWDSTGLQVLIDRHPRRHGTQALRRIISDQGLGRTIVKSELELRFLALLKANRLPLPDVNSLVPSAVGTYECDFVWPRDRLIIEVDGYERHGTRKGFEQDRARDRALAIAGWRVIRLTWRQLMEEPQALAGDLWTLLGRASALA